MTATTANVTLASRVIVPDDVLFQELNGEAVILDLASERYFGLDGVGTRFWELISHAGKNFPHSMISTILLTKWASLSWFVHPMYSRELQ